MIIHNSVIHLEIAMAVHTSVEMVLTIITMGTGVIRTGTIIEVSAVEIHMGHQEVFPDLFGHLILLRFFTHHRCGLSVVTLDFMN